MAIKVIKYNVSLNNIKPATEQFCGIQGDHLVTKLNFMLSDELYDSINNATTTGKVMYRFDVYDGEGGIWSSVPKAVTENSVNLELEEKHTRFGGKITVYLVITALSEDNETEIELYNFPAVLRLNNRPEGTNQCGENYESVTTLAEAAKNSAIAAEKSNKELQEFAATVEGKLKNGEFDGADGISATHRWDGTILTVTSASGTSSADLKGEQGEKGDKGDKGDSGADGKDAVVENTYNAESENAQSGKAVAEALETRAPKLRYNQSWAALEAVYGLTPDGEGRVLEYVSNVDFAQQSLEMLKGKLATYGEKGRLFTNTPVNDLDCANKKYVDDLIGDIETLLGGI